MLDMEFLQCQVIKTFLQATLTLSSGWKMWRLCSYSHCLKRHEPPAWLWRCSGTKGSYQRKGLGSNRARCRACPTARLEAQGFPEWCRRFSPLAWPPHTWREAASLCFSASPNPHRRKQPCSMINLLMEYRARALQGLQFYSKQFLSAAILHLCNYYSCTRSCRMLCREMEN